MDCRVAVLVLTVPALTALAGCGDLATTDAGPEAGTGTTVAADYRVTVTAVVDGDTIRVRFRNGSTDTVRLLGVDTPETRGETSPGEFEGVPDTAAGRDCLRAVGEDATRFTTERLLGETVSLRFDPAADTRGYYGRLLAYVVHDDRTVNSLLVARGYARVYDSTFSRSDRFYAAEARAQADRTRVWDCRTPGDATTTTAGNDGLAVTAINADAIGYDGDNLNDEYVVLTNTDDDSLALGGWTVSDEAGHVYTFPAGAALDPGASVTLHTGSGVDTATDRYWDQGAPVWNNNGDTVTVRDGSGTVVAQRSYTGT